jgi:hypothetical protein
VTRARVSRLLISATCAVLLTAVSWGNGVARGGGATELLPDLDPIAPTGLVVQVARDGRAKRFRVGFVSAAGNIGAGPLIIHGHRADLSTLLMTADQLIELADGSTALNPAVGVLQYVHAETHEHWHLLRFMTYELRRARDYRLVEPDQKTGFCLGDRYDVDPLTQAPGEPPDRVYNTNCGPEQTDLLQIDEGISVGWGDVYEAWRDAQYLDVTGLPAGDYVLVHRVNPGRLLRESRYSNDASSALISLSWPRGTSRKPKVRLLASCPDSARCRLP